jgi:hypothetical protein
MEERRRRDGEDVEVPDKKNVGGEDKSIAEASYQTSQYLH